jgi:hypothetical protein
LVYSYISFPTFALAITAKEICFTLLANVLISLGFGLAGGYIISIPSLIAYGILFKK